MKGQTQSLKMGLLDENKKLKFENISIVQSKRITINSKNLDTIPYLLSN